MDLEEIFKMSLEVFTNILKTNITGTFKEESINKSLDI